MDDVEQLKAEIERLKLENKRFGYEVKYYKEECEELCKEISELMYIVLPYLRGRPGDNHPVMKKIGWISGLVDRARHTHIFIDSMMRATSK